MTRRITWTSAVCLLLLAGAAPACSIPVFRYALERWKPSAYDVCLFHRGLLPAPQKALTAKFEQSAQPVNAELTALDVNGPLDDEQKALWSRHARAPLPRL